MFSKHKNTPDAQPVKIARILSSLTKMGSFLKICSDATCDTTLHPHPRLNRNVVALNRRLKPSRGLNPLGYDHYD